jgi:hypothetical protein
MGADDDGDKAPKFMVPHMRFDRINNYSD